MIPKQIKIVAATFAKIATGNGTCGFILDGEDVKSRADKNLNDYYGESRIFDRGILGFGLMFEGEDMVILDHLYNTEDAAKMALTRVAK